MESRGNACNVADRANISSLGRDFPARSIVEKDRFGWEEGREAKRGRERGSTRLTRCRTIARPKFRVNILGDYFPLTLSRELSIRIN